MSTQELDGDDSRALRLALAMARRELPPSDFSERVIADVECRAVIARELGRPRSAKTTALVASVLTLAVAAGALAVLRPRHPAPPISPEPAAAAGSVATSFEPASDPCLGRIVVAAGAAPLIDDFEDGDDAVLPLEGRSGFWRWVRETDARGTAPALLPIPRAGGTSTNRLALHVKGARLFDWGATVEFTFNPACYDASKYRGLAFEARGPGRIYVAPREISVIPVEAGGTCTGDCHNPHALKVDLDGNWRTYEVLWRDVLQRGLGKPPLEAHRLNSLAFLIRPEDTPYEAWIDNVRFVR